MKMMAMVGAFLGPAGAMLTIFLGAVVGTIVFGPVSLKTKKDVPFGVFLAFGAAIAGGSLAGPIGAFIALPTAALIVSFAQHYGTAYDVVYESRSTNDGFSNEPLSEPS